MRASIALAVAAFLAGSAFGESGAPGLRVEPGPRTIGPDEAALAPDPATGAQHGVILVEEVDRNEDHLADFEYRFHLRAKIFSAEGRSLGDIVIPDLRARTEVTGFWGRTILPDGRVLELPEDRLDEVTVVASRGRSVLKELRGALQGIVPGCVIDVGWTVHGKGFPQIRRVQLQQRWPIRLLRYRWVPSSLLTSAWVRSSFEGHQIQVSTEGNSVLVVARDLAPAADLPYGPPPDAYRPLMVFYYTDSAHEPDAYWDEVARKTEDSIKELGGKGRAVEDAVAQVGAPPGAALADRLKAAYAWVQKTLTATDLESAEDREAEVATEPKRGRVKDPAGALLAAKRGTSEEINAFFAAVARALGAEAHMLFVADRTRGIWLTPLKSTLQFDFALVAVRAAGGDGGDYTILDPASGLPYGQIPWRATGATGLLATGKEAVRLPVPPSTAEANRAKTAASVSFADDGETVRATWSRETAGAGGQDPRRRLRDLAAMDRKEELDRMCRGEAPGAEIAKADAPDLDAVGGPFRLSCDVTVGESNLTEDVTRYAFEFKGPWWPSVPELPEERRSQPLAFPYPRVDDVAVDVAPPPGFHAGAAPPPFDFSTNYGRYHLAITVAGAGYHVERELSLIPLVVPAAHYDDVRAFLRVASRFDRTPLVFVRDGGGP